MEGNEQVPKKFPVKKLQPSTDDFIDGRDAEEKRKDGNVVASEQQQQPAAAASAINPVYKKKWGAKK